MRFDLHYAHKPKSLDDTDLVAIVRTHLETPLKLLSWNALSFWVFFLTHCPTCLAQDRLLLVQPPSGIFTGTFSAKISFQHAQRCSVHFGYQEKTQTHKHKKRTAGAELRTDCCVYVKGCFHRWCFIWNPLPPYLHSAPNQLALDGLCEGGFQASGEANQNSQHVPQFYELLSRIQHETNQHRCLKDCKRVCSARSVNKSLIKCNASAHQRGFIFSQFTVV